MLDKAQFSGWMKQSIARLRRLATRCEKIVANFQINAASVCRKVLGQLSPHPCKR